MAEALPETLCLERPDVRDVDVTNQAVLELSGQRLDVLPVIAQGTFTLAGFCFDPFFCRDREQWRPVSLSDAVDAQFEVAASRACGFFRDRLRICLPDSRISCP
jgi:hypothetical protein